LRTKDSSVIHVQTGFIILQLSNDTYYQLNTTYQTYAGGEFGIMLKKLDAEKFENEKYLSDKNYFKIDKNWQSVDNEEIVNIHWNWKIEPNCKLNGQTLQVEKFIYEDSVIPNNFIFHFSNGQKIHFFVLEPDTKIEDKEIYTFVHGGEEIMIFFDENRLNYWELTTVGFEILLL